MNKLKKLLSVFVVAMLIFVNLTAVSAEETPKINLQGDEVDGYKYEFIVEDLNSSYKWTGKAIKPSIKVKQIKTKIETDEIEDTEEVEGEDIENIDVPEKVTESDLEEGKDYTVTYKNNLKVGTASVVITGKGGYQGSITQKFSIVNNKVTVTISTIKTTSAKVKFTALTDPLKKGTSISKYYLEVKDSKGKVVYKKDKVKANTNYTVSKLKAGTKYTVNIKAYAVDGNKKTYNYVIGTKTFTTQYVVGKVTLSSVKAGNEMAQVNWKAVSGASGYEIYRATSKNGKYTKVKTASKSTKSYTNYLLTANKTYYYKVRAYKTVNGKKVYGAYSAIKSAKIKKATNKTYYLRVNTRTNVTTAYAKNFSGKYVAVKALTTSCGTNGKTNAILGTHYTIAKYKWKYMHENCYTQYATRIVGHYLFHSVPYSKPQSNTLWYNSYNKLGNFASDGCVRLRVCDSKWIYDHCPLKTKVVVTYSKTDPLKKPKIAKINTKSKNRSWDPTDPNPKNPWKK